MATIEFQYNSYKTNIQALESELLRTICSKFTQKVQAEINKIKFLYSGQLVNLDLTLIQTINKFDYERKECLKWKLMHILQQSDKV